MDPNASLGSSFNTCHNLSLNASSSFSIQDEEGNVLLGLERVSVKPYRTQDEYLYAMKEDLAEWFNTLYYGLTLTVDNFFAELETGVTMCEHANTVHNYILQAKQNCQDDQVAMETMEDGVVVYRRSAKAGSFQSRDNVSNFLHWCRHCLHIPDTLLFETEDIVSRKNERNVVLCLLEVARRGAKYGVPAPTLVQMEQEIEAELEAERDPPSRPQTPPSRPQTPPSVIQPRRTIDMRSLDEMVRELLSLCTCPDQFPMYRVSEGKYKIGDQLTLIFVRILRKHVMVRIGGGWDTLENYLDRHDPCRCAAKGHKTVRGQSSPRSAKTRRASAPAPPNKPNKLSPRTTPEKPEKSSSSVTPDRRMSVPTSSLSQTRERKAPGAAVPADCDKSPENIALKRPSSPGPNRPASPAMSRPASAGSTRRPASPGPVRRPSSPGPSRRPSSPAFNHSSNSCTPNRSSSPSVQRWADPANASPNSSDTDRGRSRRPASARDRRESVSSTTETDKGSQRGRSRERPAPGCAQRSSSVGASHRRQSLNKTLKGSQYSQDANDTLMISRDSSGRHRIAPLMADKKAEDSPIRKISSAARLQMTPDRLLPSMPKLHSQTSTSSDVQDEVTRPSKKTRRTLEHSDAIDLQDKETVTSDVIVMKHKTSLEHANTIDNSDTYKQGKKAQETRDTKENSVNMKTKLAKSASLKEPSSLASSPISSNEQDQVKKPSTNLNRQRRFSLGGSGYCLAVDYDEYPEAPPENEDLNAKMELLFEEYKKVEKGLMLKKAEREKSQESDVSSKSSRDSRSRGKTKAPRSRSVTRDVLMNGNKKQTSTDTSNSALVTRKKPGSAVRYPSPAPQPRATPAKLSATTTAAVKPVTGPASSTPKSSPVKKAHARSASVGRVPISFRTKSIESLTDDSLKVHRQSKPPADGGGHHARADSAKSRSRPQSATTSTQRAATSTFKRQASKEMVGQSKTTLDKGIAKGPGLATQQSTFVKTPSASTPLKINITENKLCDTYTSFTSSRSKSKESVLLCSPEPQVGGPNLTNGYASSESGSIVDMNDTPDKKGKVKMRKDDRMGPRTRIPAPVGMRSYSKENSPLSPGLKRCDSGVDITNVSPSDNSVHGDDESPWQHTEAMSLTGQPFTFNTNDSHDLMNDDEYY